MPTIDKLAELATRAIDLLPPGRRPPPPHTCSTETKSAPRSLSAPVPTGTCDAANPPAGAGAETGEAIGTGDAVVLPAAGTGTLVCRFVVCIKPNGAHSVRSFARANTDSEFAWRECHVQVLKLQEDSGRGVPFWCVHWAMGVWCSSGSKESAGCGLSDRICMCCEWRTRVQLKSTRASNSRFNRSISPRVAFSENQRVSGLDARLAGSGEIWLALARQTEWPSNRQRELALFRVVGDSAGRARAALAVPASKRPSKSSVLRRYFTRAGLQGKCPGQQMGGARVGHRRRAASSRVVLFSAAAIY